MTKEALKLAHEALKKFHYAMIDAGVLDRQEVLNEGFTAATAIKEALAQTQEPVTTVDDNSQKWAGMDGAIAFHLIERHADGWNDIRKMMGEWLSANTPQRTWVGLTDEDISKISQRLGIDHDDSWTDLKQAIEAKLKERNT